MVGGTKAQKDIDRTVSKRRSATQRSARGKAQETCVRRWPYNLVVEVPVTRP